MLLLNDQLLFSQESKGPALTLNGTHEHNLGGHGPNNALGVDERRVAEVVEGCR